MPLPEDKRLQLDGIVNQMVQNKEPDEAIQAVVNDFKSKYEVMQPQPIMGTGETELQTKPFSFMEAIKNVPESAGRTIKNVISPLLSPVETAKGIGNIAAGFAEKLPIFQNLGMTGQEPYADAVINELSKRYGSWDNILNTLEKDPVGFGMDAAAILSGVGGAVRGAGAVTRFGGLTRAGETISKTAKAIEPLNVGRQVAGKVAGEIGEHVLGPSLGMSTGTGAEPIRRAFQGGKGFREGISGKVDVTDVVSSEKTVLQNYKSLRGQEYSQRLKDIQNMPNPPAMNISRPMREFTDSLHEYNVKLVKDPQTGKITSLDFNRSALRNNSKAQTDFNNVLDSLRNAFDDPQFYSTPEGFDILKRQISEMYHETNQGRALTEKVFKSVRQELLDKVPGYGEMVGGYEKATKMIKEIESGLSLGKKSTIEASIRKVMSTMRDDKEFARGLVEVLEQIGGQELLNQIAGVQMRRFIPGTGNYAGLGGRIAAGGLFSVLFGNVQGAAVLASTSPRLVGEFTNLLGKVVRTSGKIPPELITGTYQAGRFSDILNRNKGKEQF